MFNTQKTYHEAVLTCKNEDGDLAMAKTPAVQSLLASMTVDAGLAAYIGLSDLAEEDQFSWADGSPLDDSQTHWNADEPNDHGSGEDCVVVKINGFWNDLACSNTRAYICERDNDIPLKCDETDSWYSAGSKCFKYYSSNKNWNDAVSYCRSVGGDLVSINSDPEQDMVANTATAAGVTLWIGLTDKEGSAAGNFGWSDGEAYSYAQWASNQPESSYYTLGGDCGEITPTSNGKWSTAACTSSRAFMCERPEGSCPAGWHLFRGYCYQYNTNSPSTWSKAKFTCEAQGTYLLTDLSAAENNYIIERMSDFSDVNVGSVWLGLSDTEIDDSLQWVESSSLGYTNWGSSGSGLRNGVDDCAYITTAGSDGTWSTGNCDDSRVYICKVVATQPIMSLTPGVAISTCDAGWSLFGSNCYYFEWATKDFDDAETSCTLKGAHLTSILSEEEQMFLTMRTRMGGVFLWIGLHDIVSETDYTWTDHSTVSFTNWAPNQPDNWQSREDCVHLRSSETQAGLWNDMDGDSNKLASICKKATNEAFATCEAGWLEYGGKCYYFEWTKKNFADAENGCSAKGGHLTSINDQDEQDFLSLRAKVGGAELWIGLHDNADESSFVWTDGSPYDANIFNNWAPNQPNDWQDREDCAHMRTGSSAGLWNDKFCDTSQLASVCKKNLILRSTASPLPTPEYNSHCGTGWEYESINGNCYLFRDWDYKDWYAAREACQLEGGDLASIVSKDEQLYMNARLVLSQEDALFIGGNDFNREGGWGWSDGEGFAYVNWNAGEPNDVNGEDCMEIFTSTDNWNDINCYKQRGYICKKNGYLVTHFTVQNNRLELGTGSLSLSDVFADECAQRCVKMESFTCRAFNYDRASKKCTFFDTTSSSPMSDANVDYYERQMEVVDPVDPTVPPNYRCADHWSRYGDNCYYILSEATMTYSAAQTSCGNINGVEGGTLASIHDSNENSFIRALANEKGATGKVWIGLNDLNDPMSFQWDDATSVDFAEWNHNEPNNYRGRAEDCVEMYTNSYWNDALCNKKRAAVCKRPREDLPATQFPITPTGCSGSDTAFSYYCYSVSSSANTWEGALADCRSNGGDLVSVMDRYEQTVLASILGAEDGSKVWIGLNDRDNQGQYVWSDGSKVSYTNWDYSYPDDTKGRCTTSTSGLLAGLWSNIDCSSNLKYMCKRVRTGYTVPPPITTLPPTQPSNIGCAWGWTGYGNNCFRAFSVNSATKATWQTARDRCVNMGGDLASFHTAEEENYIFANSGSTQTSGYWIGLHDRGTEGGFEWSDGTPVEHTNWNGGEPNDWGSGEDCTETFFTSKVWNDQSCDSARNWICKIPKGQTPITTPEPTTPTPWPSCDNDPDWLKYDTGMGTYCYFFSAGATVDGRNKNWFDANEYCMEAGGYLVSIHSQDENDFLKTHLARYGYTQPWIGMREYTVEGTYTWSDKSSVDFTLWGPSEPNDANGEEQCVELYSSSGVWNDVNCGKESNFICRKANGATGRVTHPPTSPPVGNCLAGYWRFDNKCYIMYGEDGIKSWYDARTTCRTVEGRDLATIHSRELQAFLSSKMVNVTFNVYVGLSDTLNNGRFLWTDGSGVDFTNWDGGEPNDYGSGEDCTEMLFRQDKVGLWNDITCSVALGYICQMDLDPDAAEQPINSGDCREGFTQYGTSCFQVIDRTYIYEEAQASCRTLGDDVNLASIANSYEEAFAEAQTYLSGGQNLWIGLTHDMETETYSWVDSHPVWYTFWAENEPSGESSEGCVTLLGTGGWDDTACNLLYKPLCKYSTVPVPTEHPDIPGNCSEGWMPYSSYCYLVVNDNGDNARSWPGANYECEQLGGTLASYHTLQENNKIRDIAAAGSNNIWIGLSRGDSGGFEWIDDSPMDFTNWNTGKPSYETDRGIKDCVEMLRQTGKWNDLDCWNTRGYVCIMPKSGIPTAVPTTDTPNINRPPKAGLSGGEITGIVLGCILVICLAALITFFLVSYRSAAFKKEVKEPEIPSSVSFNNVLYKEKGNGSVQVNTYDLDSKA